MDLIFGFLEKKFHYFGFGMQFIHDYETILEYWVSLIGIFLGQIIDYETEYMKYWYSKS